MNLSIAGEKSSAYLAFRTPKFFLLLHTGPREAAAPHPQALAPAGLPPAAGRWVGLRDQGAPLVSKQLSPQQAHSNPTPIFKSENGSRKSSQERASAIMTLGLSKYPLLRAKLRFKRGQREWKI